MFFFNSAVSVLYSFTSSLDIFEAYFFHRSYFVHSLFSLYAKHLLFFLFMISSCNILLCLVSNGVSRPCGLPALYQPSHAREAVGRHSFCIAGVGAAVASWVSSLSP